MPLATSNASRSSVPTPRADDSATSRTDRERADAARNFNREDRRLPARPSTIDGDGRQRRRLAKLRTSTVPAQGEAEGTPGSPVMPGTTTLQRLHENGLLAEADFEHSLEGLSRHGGAAIAEPALAHLLERFSARLARHSEDREAILERLDKLSGSGYLDGARSTQVGAFRQRVLSPEPDGRSSTQPAGPSLGDEMAAYRSARTPAERIVLRQAIRSRLSSASMAPAERDRALADLHAVDADRLHAQLMLDASRSFGTTDRVLASLHAPATMLSRLMAGNRSGNANEPNAFGVEHAMNLVSFIKGGYAFVSRPSTGTAFVAIRDYAITAMAMYAARHSLATIVKGTGLAAAQRKALQPIPDSGGVNRTGEIADAMERVSAMFPAREDHLALEFVMGSFRRSLSEDSAFATSLADLLAARDPALAAAALDRVIGSSRQFRELAGMGLFSAAPELRDAVMTLESRRDGTSAAMQELGMNARDEHGELALNDEANREVVRNTAHLDGHQPMHDEEGGIYHQVYRHLNAENAARGADPLELVRSLLTRLRDDSAKALPASRQETIDAKLDALLLQLRRSPAQFNADVARMEAALSAR